MIVLWSPYTAGPAASVVNYLLAPTVEKSVAGQCEEVVRDPTPEVLYGDPDLVHSCIEALTTRHRYCCATLSFAREDVDIAEWKTGNHGGLPASRCPDLHRASGASLPQLLRLERSQGRRR